MDAIAISGGAESPGKRQLEVLRARVRAIERADLRLEVADENAHLAKVENQSTDVSLPDAWTFGARKIDCLLGPAGLRLGGVHEFKPTDEVLGLHWAGVWGAALSVVMGLAGRRFAMLGGRGMAAGSARRGAMLWCATADLTRELGRLYGGGLAPFAVAPRQVLVVEPRKAAEVLWALEEGLKVGQLALVGGLVNEVGLTPARRLALAAEKSDTPCMVITGPRSPPMASTTTRWRVAPCPSGRTVGDGRAPGRLRVALTLERVTARMLSVGASIEGASTFVVEWSHEAGRFCVVGDVGDRADATRDVGRGAVGAWR